MFTNSSSSVKDKAACLQLVATNSEPDTIKVFDTKGKKAKTINLEQGIRGNELNLKMVDLEKGVYVVNAFRRGNFVKAFRFVKD